MPRKANWGKMKIRVWSQFFDTACFSQPKDIKAWTGRVNTNIIYYQANYICLMCLFMVYVCIARPLFFLALGAVMGAGYYLFVFRTEPLVVNGLPVRRRNLQIGFFSGSMIIFLIFGGYQCMMALALSCAVLLVHSTFRNASMKAKSTNAFHAMTGNITPMQSLIDDFDGNDEVNPQANETKQEILKKQAAFRSRFRANMRAKYLPKS